MYSTYMQDVGIRNNNNNNNDSIGNRAAEFYVAIGLAVMITGDL